MADTNLFDGAPLLPAAALLPDAAAVEIAAPPFCCPLATGWLPLAFAAVPAPPFGPAALPPAAFPAGDAGGLDGTTGGYTASVMRTHALGLLRSEASVRGRVAMIGCASDAGLTGVAAAAASLRPAFAAGLASAAFTALSALPAPPRATTNISRGQPPAETMRLGDDVEGQLFV